MLITILLQRFASITIISFMYALTWLPQQELNCVSIIILLYQEYAYKQIREFH